MCKNNGGVYKHLLLYKILEHLCLEHPKKSVHVHLNTTMGFTCQLSPEIFFEKFKKKSEKIRFVKPNT